MARSVQELGYVRREIYDAFNAWNGVSTIRLTETSDPSADIQISFERGHHGDAYPFDRPEVLAHAFPPFDHEMAGDIHLGLVYYEDASGGSQAVGTARKIIWDGNANFKTPAVTGSYTITLDEKAQTVTIQ